MKIWIVSLYTGCLHGGKQKCAWSAADSKILSIANIIFYLNTVSVLIKSFCIVLTVFLMASHEKRDESREKQEEFREKRDGGNLHLSGTVFEKNTRGAFKSQRNAGEKQKQ